MAPFVHGNDMQTCGQGETYSGNEGISKVQSGQVEIAMGAQEGANLILLVTETSKGVSQR